MTGNCKRITLVRIINLNYNKMEIVNVKTENLAIANELKDYLIKHKISNVDADMFLEVIDFIRIDREKQLKLCEVGVTLKDKKTPTFEDWLIEHKCVVTLNKNIFIKTGHSFHLKELERWYKEEFNL